MAKEKKISKRVRIPESIVLEIEQEANEKGLDFSKVVVYRLRHFTHPLTPVVVIKVQNIVNTAIAAVKNGSVGSLKTIQMEVNDLWRYLRYGDMLNQEKNT